MSQREPLIPERSEPRSRQDTTSEESVTDALIDLLRRRQEVGVAKYGVSLYTNNGRDAMVDCLQETTDALQYLVQELLEARQVVGAVWLYLKNAREEFEIEDNLLDMQLDVARQLLEEYLGGADKIPVRRDYDSTLAAVLNARIVRTARVESALLQAYKEDRTISPDEAKARAMELGNATSD